jgi:hypothetical protein
MTKNYFAPRPLPLALQALLLLTISLFAISCHSENKKNDDQLLTFDLRELPKTSTVTLSQLGFDDIEYIPLETNDSSVITGTNDIFMPIKIIVGKKFYIVKRHKTLLSFRDNGQFVTRIGTVGRGPNEFTVAHDADVDEKSQQIYLLARWQKKFFVYSENGQLLRTFPLLISPNEFCFYGNRILCYSENHMGDIENSFDLIDSSGLIEKSFPNKYPFKNHDAYGINHENLSYHFYNRLFKKEVYSDTVYEFKNMNFKPHLVIEVGEKLITPKARTEFDGLYLGKNFISPFKLFEFGDYVYYEFMYRIVIPDDILIYSFIGSKKNNFQALIKTDQGIINDLDGGPAIQPRTVKDDNTIIALVDVMQFKKHIASEEFRNSKTKYPEKKIELEKLAASLKETDNPVLVLVRLKK